MLETKAINTRRAAEFLSDAELLAQVGALAVAEREATARLVAVLAEMDARCLHLGQGCASLFTYCTQVLHMSEHAAYSRIEAARAARKFPVLLDQLAEGSLHLTAVRLLARHLTPENHLDVIVAARHKTKRQVEEIVAALRPQLAVPSSIRKSPDAKRSIPSSSVGPIASPSADASVKPNNARELPVPDNRHQRRAEVRPLATDLYKVRFTISRDTHEKLQLARDLLRHAIPSGDVAAVVDRALTLLVKHLQSAKHAATLRPRSSEACRASYNRRYIPAAVRRAVWARDDGRCAFIGAVGRCSERTMLEYHHRIPFADGGQATADNLELRCRAHNGYEAARWSGADIARDANAAYAGGTGTDFIYSSGAEVWSHRLTRSGPSREESTALRPYFEYRANRTGKRESP
jgi:5-methylcytosine-specific restriction endonuclease McrA